MASLPRIEGERSIAPVDPFSFQPALDDESQRLLSLVDLVRGSYRYIQHQRPTLFELEVEIFTAVEIEYLFQATLEEDGPNCLRWVLVIF